MGVQELFEYFKKPNDNVQAETPSSFATGRNDIGGRTQAHWNSYWQVYMSLMNK